MNDGENSDSGPSETPAERPKELPKKPPHVPYQRKPRGGDRRSKRWRQAHGILDHGLTSVLQPGRRRWKRRKPIDLRFREGRETVAFRASLIEMKGGTDNMTPAQVAVADVLTVKYHRLLKVYTYLYRHPAPPILNERRKQIFSLWMQVDTLEDSFVRVAKEYGFGRVAKTVSLHEILAKEDTKPANTNGS